MNHLPTQEQLKRLMKYDPETGVFTRISTSGGCVAGEVAGTLDSHGYRQIRVGGSKHLAHRLAWVYMYGVPPSMRIDHINRIKSDNRISNLREVTVSESNQNRSIGAGNKSSYRGVSLAGKLKKWQARISVNGIRKSLGYFHTAEAAYQAYKAGVRQMHTHNPVNEETS